MSEDDTLPDPPEVEEEVSSPEESAPEQTDDTPEPASEAPAVDVWNNFRTMPEFDGQDDMAIANRLYAAMQREAEANRALQQYQTVMPIAQQYLNDRPEFEEWRRMRSQQQAQPAAPQAEQPRQRMPWEPPEIKDSYKRYLTRDENGREVISADAPLDARAALEEYQEFRANFAQKLLDNPQEAIGPMIESVATQRAQEIMDERLSRMKDEDYVYGLEQENKDWLYDENGNVSAEGIAVQKYIQDAKDKGIGDARARWDYATMRVERDLLLATLQSQVQQPAPQAPAPQAAPQQEQPSMAQQNMEFLRQQAMRTASQRSSEPTTARAPSRAMTFEERLTAAAQSAGLL